MSPIHLQALHYVKNTGYSATVAQFDDDHEPVGPMLRRDLMPKYMIINSKGKVELTDAAIEAICSARDAAGKPHG